MEKTDPIERLEAEQRRIANLKDGVPCGHPGCLSHISHPCEGCGRVGGRRTNFCRSPRVSWLYKRGGSKTSLWHR